MEVRMIYIIHCRDNVVDNVDHNVRTLDGKGTHHAMEKLISTTGGMKWYDILLI